MLLILRLNNTDELIKGTLFNKVQYGSEGAGGENKYFRMSPPIRRAVLVDSIRPTIKL